MQKWDDELEDLQNMLNELKRIVQCLRHMGKNAKVQKKLISKLKCVLNDGATVEKQKKKSYIFEKRDTVCSMRLVDMMQLVTNIQSTAANVDSQSSQQLQYMMKSCTGGAVAGGAATWMAIMMTL